MSQQPQPNAPEEVKKEIGFRAIKRKQKGKAGRGFEDAQSVIDTMKEDWEGLQEELNQLPDEEQDKMKEHFN